MQRSSTRSEDFECFFCDNWWWMLLVLLFLVVTAATFNTWSPWIGLSPARNPGSALPGAAQPVLQPTPALTVAATPASNSGSPVEATATSSAPAAAPAAPADPTAGAAKIAVGQPAPDFNLQTLDGGQVSLSSLNGKPVLVVFMASWCPQCRSEAPLLKDAAAKHQDDGLQVVAVDITFNDQEEDIRAFVEEQGWTFPVGLDRTGDVSRLYQQDTTPVHYLIGRNGVLEAILVDELDQKQLEDNLKLILR